MGKATCIGNEIIIQFRYDPVLVAKIKDIPGRKYCPDTKAWKVPACDLSLDHLNGIPEIRMTQSVAQAQGRNPMNTQPGKTGEIIVHFPYDEELIKDIKTVYGIRWDKEKKYWTAPYKTHTLKYLRKLGFDTSETPEERISFDITPTAGQLPDHFLDGLYNFQLIGFRFIERMGGRALIADQMGLGKTIIALAYLAAHPEMRPAIIVCPSSVKLNWGREINKWLKKPCTVLSGRVADPRMQSDISIINYEILHNSDDTEKSWVEHFKKKVKPRIVIADECHYFKTDKSLRTKAVKKLGKITPYFVALSGTPITNRPIDAFNALNIIRPEIFPSRWEFGKRYCDLKDTWQGLDWTGNSNEAELHELLKETCMIRRVKSEVLQDLPPIQRTIVPMGISNAAYNSYKKKLEQMTQYQGSTVGAMQEIEKMKQDILRAKLPSCIQWIQDFVDTGEKLVVFTYHHEAIDALKAKFKDIAVVLDGRTPMKKRQKAIDEFQEGDRARLFLGNIKAAGTGITLTAASNTCFIELPWIPSDLDQCESRTNRIGSTGTSNNAWYLLADGTFEECIAQVLDSKRKVIDKIIDGKETDESSLLSELMRLIKGGLT